MKDPLETQIAALTLRRAPASWKETIVPETSKIAPSNFGKRSRVNLLALAASWILIGLLHWYSAQSQAPEFSRTSTFSLPPNLDYTSYLQELIEAPETKPEFLPTVPSKSRIQGGIPNRPSTFTI